jgi:O-antigen/teichoic acid export membrane protein
VRSNRSVRQNSIALLLSRLTAQGLGILFVSILARTLGLEMFGRFAVYAVLVLIGNTFTNFGTDTYLIREISRIGKIDSLLPTAFGLQLLLAVFWWLATLLLRPEPELLVYSLTLFPLAATSLATASLRAFERMDRVWSISLVNSVVQILAALMSNDLWSLCVYLLFGQLLVAGISYWICSASLEAFRLLPFVNIRPLLRVTLPFAALTILIVLTQRLGILSVSFLLGDAPTGLFSSITRIVDGLKLGHYAVLGSLLPVISRATREAKQSFRYGFGLLMALTFFMAVGLTVFPRLVLVILYGDAFVAAAGWLPLVGWSLIPYTISSFISYYLIARGKEVILVKATVVSLIVFLALYFLLISMLGLAGAAYAALGGEVCQAVIFILYGYRSNNSIQLLTTWEHRNDDS